MTQLIITKKQLDILLESVIKEGNNETYFNSYSSAISYALDAVRKKGYEIKDDDIWTNVSVGPSKPEQGKTIRLSLPLYKDGKEQRKMLHIQVYGMNKNHSDVGLEADKYELNFYVN